MLKQSEYNFNKLTIHFRYSVLRFNYQQSIHCTYIPIRNILNLVLRFHKQLLLYSGASAPARQRSSIAKEIW